MAIYIVCSQLSTFGFHLSVLKWSAKYQNNRAVLNNILLSGLIMTMASCLFTVLIVMLASNLAEQIFKIPQFAYSLLLLIPGIVFFSFNKVLLGFINGLSRMIDFAILTSIRYICMVSVLIVLIVYGIDSKNISLVFVISELVVFILCICLLYPEIKIVSFKKLKKWLLIHLDFGMKAFLGGASLELNSRVDVLILALFVSETEVGLYSFALFFAEGLLQFITIVRNSINPIITTLYYEKQTSLLKERLDGICRKLIFFMLAIGILVIIFFYLYTNMFIANPSYYKSNIILAILTVGIISASYYLPLQFFLAQINQPLIQSKLNFYMLISNVILNIIMILAFGIYGAAIATGLSFIVNALLIKQKLSAYLFSRG
jgi:O-antigen/teichoic acid export membrane protein